MDFLSIVISHTCETVCLLVYIVLWSLLYVLFCLHQHLGLLYCTARSCIDNTDISKDNTDISKDNTDISKDNTDISKDNTDISKDNTDINKDNTDINKDNTDISSSLLYLHNTSFFIDLL